MFKKALVMVPAFWLLCTVVAVAADINYMAVDDFKSMLDGQKPVVIADIQKPKDFQKHHFYTAIETDAYPVKKDASKQLLDKVVDMYEKTGNPIVIVGPRGSSASKRAYKYLLEQDVPAQKVFILKGGLRAWPYKELLIDLSGGCA